MLKTLMQILKGPSQTPERKKKKDSTSSLEKTGELVDLSTLEFDEDPVNPYGKHVQTIQIDVFEKGQLISIFYKGKVLSKDFYVNKR